MLMVATSFLLRVIFKIIVSKESRVRSSIAQAGPRVAIWNHESHFAHSWLCIMAFLLRSIFKVPGSRESVVRTVPFCTRLGHMETLKSLCKLTEAMSSFLGYRFRCPCVTGSNLNSVFNRTGLGHIQTSKSLCM